MLKHFVAVLMLIVSAGLHAQIVINEVDYDQPGTDAEEYIEIYNAGPAAYPLQYLQVVLMNGNAGGAAEYRTIESVSWPALMPGEFFVICANAGTPNCDEVTPPATNLIQNGSPDAIALVMTQPEPFVVDVLSYGGNVPGYTEGTGTTVEDSNLAIGVSLGRYPDGVDVQDNDLDFVLMCSTPGTANVVDPQECDLTSSVLAAGASQTFMVLPAPGGQGALIHDANAGGEGLSFELFTVDGALVGSKSVGAGRASWHVDLGDLRGRVLLIRLTTPTRRETRRILLP